MTHSQPAAPVTETLVSIQAYLAKGWQCDEHAMDAITALLRERPECSYDLLTIVAPKLPGVSDELLGRLWEQAIIPLHEHWIEPLWADMKMRKDPAGCAIKVTQQLNLPQSQVQGYLLLHERLRRQSATCASRLSKALADNALNYAFVGLWNGAGSLLTHILQRETPHGFTFSIGTGVGGWWMSLAQALARVYQKREPQRSGLLNHAGLVEHMQILVESGLRADTEEGMACGRVLLQGLEIAPTTFVPVFDLWMEAGGNWEQLRNTGTPEEQAWIDIFPRVRRTRLLPVGMPSDDDCRSAL